ncbi:MAG: hypothetical protein EPN84_06440 [Legionella sp.]|nr:MAG: hypothetical protein EPN84_06440 [Legionella sp.]
MRILTTGALCLLAFNAQANVIQYFVAGVSYSNPSELFKTKKGQFIIGGTGSYADLEFTGSVFNFNTEQYGMGTNSSKTYTLLPYGRLAKRLNDKIVVSLDVTEPFNSNLDWGTEPFTRYANTENFMTDVDVSPRFSYDVNQKLHLGAGLNLNFITDNQVNFAMPTGATTWANLMNNSTSFGLGYDLGISYVINQTNFINAFYYSSIQQNTKGHSSLGPLYSDNLNIALKLPSTASINYVHLFNQKWLASVKVFRIGWDSIKIVNMYNTAVPAPMSDFTFHMNYEPAYALQGTIRNQFTDKLGIAVHGMIDNSPAQEGHRSLPFPADTQYLMGISGDYRINDITVIELFYGHVVSYPTIQNQVNTPGGSIPFTTGKVDINANILDLRLKIEA